MATIKKIYKNGVEYQMPQGPKGDTGATGPQGPQGDSFQPIEDVSGLVLAHTTGQDNTKAMTQKAVTEQLDYVRSLIPMIEVDEDGFFVVDENYNIGFGVTGSGVVGFKNVGYK